MRGVVGGRAGMVVAFLLGLVIATAGTATAARLITGKQIKDGSVAARDLTKSVRAADRQDGRGRSARRARATRARRRARPAAT